MALPIPITQDFQRDYKFAFAIFQEGGISALLNGQLFETLLAVAPMAYVSQLAQRVDIPDREVAMEDVGISVVNAPFPRSYRLNTVTVEFLEDSGGLVYNFFQTWQESGRSGNGLTFRELGSITLSILFSNTVDLPIGGPESEIPINATVYPYVYPFRISRGRFDKSGESLKSIVVTFARLPRFRFR